MCPLCKFDSVNCDDIQQHKIQWHKQIEAVEETKDKPISPCPAEQEEEDPIAFDSITEHSVPEVTKGTTKGSAQTI